VSFGAPLPPRPPRPVEVREAVQGLIADAWQFRRAPHGADAAQFRPRGGAAIRAGLR